MITHKRTLTGRRPTRPPSPADVTLLSELECEVARLESKRNRAVTISERLFSQVNIDDTGFRLHRALSAVNQLNDRIAQLRNLIEQVQSRVC